MGMWLISRGVPNRTFGARCSKCHASRQNVDYLHADMFEIDDEYGAICRLCFEEGARQLGWIPASEVKVVEVPVQHDHDQWYAEWQRVEALADELVNRIVEHTEAIE